MEVGRWCVNITLALENSGTDSHAYYAARSPDFGAEKTHGFHAMMGKLRLRGETSLSGPIYGR